jgi:hypothetical protein
LCFGGFLFSCGALLRVLDLAGARPTVPWLAIWFLALGICNSTPYLLNRATVYEIPIASGFCSMAGGLFFLSRAVGPQARVWAAAASGAMFGLAVASRAHLLLAGAVALAALTVYCWRRRSRTWLAFAAAWCVAGVAIGVYNYERFGSPLEFGFRYQLAGPGQNRVELAARNVTPGAYYMLLSPPHFSSVFPWVRMVFRFPFDSAERHPLPPEYFVEPTIGALWLAPFVIGALLIPGRRHKEARLIPTAALAMGAAVLLFLIPSHLATQRYEADFLPLLVFAAVANIALMNRRAPAAIACVLIAWSAAANLALAEQGPYDDFLKKHPERYVRLARRFPSPSEARVALNPAIRVRLAARLDEIGYRDPLVTIGQSHYCYFLFSQRAEGGGFRIVGKSTESEVEQRIGAPGGAPVTIGLVYDAKSGDVSMSVNGSTVVHHVGMLVAAPAQVTIGENFADMGLTSRYFRGELKVLEKTVGLP